MSLSTIRWFFAAAISLSVLSCAENTEKKPTGPTSENSSLPWNTPVAGQGQGQLGMLPQNQYRR